jgi:metal-responsive CopG/Arc/MetJ family transcriptional regulator
VKRKIRISATVDPDLEERLERFLKKSKFRNKSHVIEEAVEEFIKRGGR